MEVIFLLRSTEVASISWELLPVSSFFPTFPPSLMGIHRRHLRERQYCSVGKCRIPKRNACISSVPNTSILSPIHSLLALCSWGDKWTECKWQISLNLYLAFAGILENKSSLHRRGSQAEEGSVSTNHLLWKTTKFFLPCTFPFPISLSPRGQWLHTAEAAPAWVRPPLSLLSKAGQAPRLVMHLIVPLIN